MSSKPNASSEELYCRAYSIHYDNRDLEKALVLYREIIDGFPDSNEARYSQSQIENIEKELNPPTIGLQELPWAQVDDKIKNNFVCRKCGKREAAVKRIAMTSAGLSRLFDIQHNRFLSVSCCQCGFSELYDLEVLEGKDVVKALIDVIIG